MSKGNGASGHKGSGTMSKGGMGRRSVGAGGAHPNGAILEDDFQVHLGKEDNFKEWAKKYRAKKSLKPNSTNEWFDNMTVPMKGNK